MSFTYSFKRSLPDGPLRRWWGTLPARTRRGVVSSAAHKAGGAALGALPSGSSRTTTAVSGRRCGRPPPGAGPYPAATSPCAELCKDSPPCGQDHCNPPTSSSPTSPGSAEPRCFPSQSYGQSLVTLHRQGDGICLSSYKCTFFVSLFGEQTKLLTELYSVKSCCQLVCKSTFSILHLRKLKLKG